ncbi:N-acetyl-gamma-glutamyl-phosphate reductase [Oceanispirochaeta sp.]|jgi:N-acetyl-gamma-glutamyl-phosphate reductase|uniref:N-acetyl-gamma-glutamyl-phosphate reductase n=1 Tax=Oceanispirochaeta sp. TaxID=2035350 RepID=UPI0026086566|nr:N-acetyl-gamma-glutamyl-phosphate reductase [Oceanispirochaeta sp.]MDA3957778.1 N-acetyl-gamma-glutamyl-phosphate reductase [Oceanispirochaeta sp.]
MKAVVLGATGYTGQILLRQLSSHQDIESIIPASSSIAGSKVLDSDPGLHRSIIKKMELTRGEYVSIEEAASYKADIVFSALPHLASAQVCDPFYDHSVVIDLSADFRMEDPELFLKAYGKYPPRAERLASAVYGLSELYRDKIMKSDLIANPGCYPTASLLPLFPLLKKKLIKKNIMINALSGISGAGKKANTSNLLVERSENICAYAPGMTHRHSWEIAKEIHKEDPLVKILFVPHLVPMKRGMAITSSCELTEDISPDSLEDIYKNFYGDSPFVHTVFPAIPETKQVWGSNRCDISWHMEGRTLILFSVIDNLIKGASGQAIQNMNIRFGLDETAGLRLHGEI